MGGMLSIQMNDAAARMLGACDGLLSASRPAAVDAGLEDVLARGLARCGQVLTWAGSFADASGALSFFPDLTAGECSGSSFRLEDFVSVDADVIGDAPVIGEAGQRTLLSQGLAFGLRFAGLVRSLGGLVPVRCIIAANETNATFRFHRIREGERWNRPGLDGYELGKMIVIDIVPAIG